MHTQTDICHKMVNAIQTSTNQLLWLIASFSHFSFTFYPYSSDIPVPASSKDRGYSTEFQLKHITYKMLSSFTSWLSGGSDTAQDKTEAEEDKSTPEKSTDTSSQPQGAAEATENSWAGEPLLRLGSCTVDDPERGCCVHRVDI